MVNITVTEMLDEILNDIVSIGAIHASAIVANNGNMIAYKVNRNDIDADTIGALIAMLTRSAVHTAKELNKGEIEYLLVKTKKGQIIIMKTNSNIILTALSDTSVNISLTIKEMRKACEKISNIFARV